jgi:hypothetical protein
MSGAAILVEKSKPPSFRRGIQLYPSQDKEVPHPMNLMTTMILEAVAMTHRHHLLKSDALGALHIGWKYYITDALANLTKSFKRMEKG